jgi:hypothetical protein
MVQRKRASPAILLAGAAIGLLLYAGLGLTCWLAVSRGWLTGAELFLVFVAFIMSVPWCMLGFRLRRLAAARRKERDAPGGLPRAQVRKRADS